MRNVCESKTTIVPYLQKSVPNHQKHPTKRFEISLVLTTCWACNDTSRTFSNCTRSKSDMHTPTTCALLSDPSCSKLYRSRVVSFLYSFLPPKSRSWTQDIKIAKNLKVANVAFARQEGHERRLDGFPQLSAAGRFGRIHGRAPMEGELQEIQDCTPVRPLLSGAQIMEILGVVRIQENIFGGHVLAARPDQFHLNNK